MVWLMRPIRPSTGSLDELLSLSGCVSKILTRFYETGSIRWVVQDANAVYRRISNRFFPGPARLAAPKLRFVNMQVFNLISFAFVVFARTFCSSDGTNWPRSERTIEVQLRIMRGFAFDWIITTSTCLKRKSLAAGLVRQTRLNRSH